MSGIQYTWGKEEMLTNFRSINLKGRTYLRELGLNGVIILKLIFGVDSTGSG